MAGSSARSLSVAVSLSVVALLAVPTASVAEDVKPFKVTAAKVVSGPIPSTATSYAYIMDGVGVALPVPDGYVEEEYFISGKGNIYEYTATGIRVVDPCPPAATLGCKDVPWVTRMIVKRPRNPHQFSGTVVIEPLNATGGFDIAGVWDRSRHYFVRNGDIFVGWTAKSVTVNMLKTWDPTRYADLSWPYAPFAGQTNNSPLDGITFDAASQIGALFRTNGPNSPVHAYKVKHVFETGFSQDGGYTFAQALVFHDLARMPDGGPIYDGYVPGGTTGPSNINFGLTTNGAYTTATGKLPQMGPRSAPVIHVNTESEVLLVSRLGYRRPDSDAANDRYRLWEVAGASHISNDLRDAVIALQLNDAETHRIDPSMLEPIGCTHMEFTDGPVTGLPGFVDPNDYPFAYVENAAFHWLTRWVETGKAPPHAGFITTDALGVVRDVNGNALGGVRTPFVDVPITTFTPFDTVAFKTTFSAFCGIYGYNALFPEAKLQTLYRNHGDYVMRFVFGTAGVVEHGFWLLPDAVDAIQRAVHADVP